MLHLLQATVAIHMIWNSSAWETILLYTLGCNTIPLYFVIQIILVWPLGTNSQLIPVSFLAHTHHSIFIAFFFVFEKLLITF